MAEPAPHDPPREMPAVDTEPSRDAASDKHDTDGAARAEPDGAQEAAASAESSGVGGAAAAPAPVAPRDTGKAKAEEADTAPALSAAPSAGHARRPELPADKPFDFNRFLEQMKHRSAVPVNEYVRSFFRGFTRRPYKPDEQAKLIFDFLDFIAARMAEAAVWADLPPAEFDQATEAMEKLVMNRLYTYTFTPAMAAEGRWPVLSDDLERDRALSERIQLFHWVDETHLDLKRGPHSERFFAFAAQELAKINHYKAPRDKTICVLNCCKVIFGLIRHLGADEGADAFMPLLILVLLRANPPHLVSNVEYIARFRSPPRRTSESEYYLSSLSGAMAFIEQMDHTKLSHVSQTELDERVQKAAAEMEAAVADPPDEPALSLSATMAATALADDTKAFLQRTGKAARMGFTRLFSERPDTLTMISPRLGEAERGAPPPPRAPATGAARASPAAAPAAAAAAPASDEPSAASIQALQAIFTQTDAHVLRLVLDECHGNVESAIDRLLDMT